MAIDDWCNYQDRKIGPRKSQPTPQGVPTNLFQPELNPMLVVETTPSDTYIGRMRAAILNRLR